MSPSPLWSWRSGFILCSLFPLPCYTALSRSQERVNPQEWPHCFLGERWSGWLKPPTSSHRPPVPSWTGRWAVGVPPPWLRNLPSSLQPAGRGAGAGFCLLFSVSQSSRSSSLRQCFCHQLFDGERTQRRVTSSYQYVCAFPNLSPPRSAPRPGRVCNAQGSPFIQGPIQRLRHFHSARPHLPKPTPYFLPINHVPSHG